jgi:release factor glutamine methyltransferase
MTSIGEWLDDAYQVLSSSNDFDDDIYLTLKFLLEARLKRESHYFAEEPLPEQLKVILKDDLEALSNGVPLPYILGEWSFFGNDFILSPDVLIPRPETESLVEEALSWLSNFPINKIPTIYDIGTGSGIIAISLAKTYPKSNILASDVSVDALRICRMNLQKHKVSDIISTVEADGIPDGITTIDLLCANLPYISETSLEKLKVTKFEPRLALDGGRDGLRIIEKVLQQSLSRMNHKSLLLFEIEESQQLDALALTKHYYPESQASVLKDFAGKHRLLRIENLQ